MWYCSRTQKTNANREELTCLTAKDRLITFKLFEKREVLMLSTMDYHDITVTKKKDINWTEDGIRKYSSISRHDIAE